MLVRGASVLLHLRVPKFYFCSDAFLRCLLLPFPQKRVALYCRSLAIFASVQNLIRVPARTRTYGAGTCFSRIHLYSVRRWTSSWRAASEIEYVTIERIHSLYILSRENRGLDGISLFEPIRDYPNLVRGAHLGGMLETRQETVALKDAPH